MMAETPDLEDVKAKIHMLYNELKGLCEALGIPWPPPK